MPNKGGRERGELDESNKHKTFNQETAVRVPCETISNVDLFCHVSLKSRDSSVSSVL